MINKWMTKINGEEIYNTIGPPRKGGKKREKERKDGCSSYYPRKLP